MEDAPQRYLKLVEGAINNTNVDADVKQVHELVKGKYKEGKLIGVSK